MSPNRRAKVNPFQLGHSEKVYLAILTCLALSCLGFFVENRLAALGLAPQALMGADTTPLGLSSGGRVRGGGFDAAPSSRPSPSPSGGSLTGPSPGGYSGGWPETRPYGYPSSPYGYPRGGPVVIAPPYPGGYIGYPSSGVTLGGDVGLLFLLAVLGFAVLPVIFNLLKLRDPDRSSRDRTDRVTVTAVQVGLLATARGLQQDLTTLATASDLNSQMGLHRLLQESVLALLRSPECWSHARVTCQTLASRQQAAQVFEQLSITERSKFAQETLANVEGQIRRQDYRAAGEAEPAAYIVVNLLVGTTDDQPLFTRSPYSASDLQAALQRLGAIPPADLLVYELLWTPQDPRDSLSHDQMLAHFPDLVQIA